MSDKLKTHKFARKPFYVDAIRVSEENITRVAEWCNGEVQSDDEGQHIKVKVHRPLTDRQTKAYIGDWVLFAGTGFKVYTPKAFDKSFEKVKTLTKAQADEAGITVPHEKRQPRKIENARLHSVSVDAKPGPGGGRIEAGEGLSVAPNEEAVKDIGMFGDKPKDEVDELFDEVLKG